MFIHNVCLNVQSHWLVFQQNFTGFINSIAIYEADLRLKSVKPSSFLLVSVAHLCDQLPPSHKTPNRENSH